MGKTAYSIIEILYRDAGASLVRKHNAAINIINKVVVNLELANVVGYGKRSVGNITLVSK